MKRKPAHKLGNWNVKGIRLKAGKAPGDETDDGRLFNAVRRGQQRGFDLLGLPMDGRKGKR